MIIRASILFMLAALLAACNKEKER